MTKEIQAIIHQWSLAIWETPNTRLLDFYTQQHDAITHSTVWTTEEKQYLIQYLFGLIWNTVPIIYDQDLQIDIMQALDHKLTNDNIDLTTFIPEVLEIYNLEFISKILQYCKNVARLLHTSPDKHRLLKRLILAAEQPNDSMQTQDHPYKLFVQIFEQLFATKLVDYLDEDGRTILHILSSDSNNSELAKDIITRYPELLNVLDINGNSALYYQISQGDAGQNNWRDAVCYSSEHDLVTEMLNKGAKHIRNHVEEKTPLHLQVALNIPIVRSQQVMANLNVQDLEQGRTPLHYAILLDNNVATKTLLQLGADYTIPDKLQQTPLYYAFVSGRVDVVKNIFSALTLHEQKTLLQKLTADNIANGKNSYLTAAALSGDKELFGLAKQLMSGAYTAIDAAILRQLEVATPHTLDILLNRAQAFDLPDISQFSSQEQLTILLAASAQNALKKNILWIYTSAILPKLFSSPNTLRAGTAYGVELEISNLPCMPNLPLQALLEEFKAIITHDGSVTLPFFSESNTCLRGEEIVSGILDTSAKVEQLIFLSKTLRESGATTNKSNGLHVHVNIYGKWQEWPPSITRGMQLRWFDTKQVELAVVKQLLSNWSQAEPLLQGVLRGGQLMDSNSHAARYASLIHDEVDYLLDCDTFDELLSRADDRYKTFNLMSLRRHGTVEIRMHEGTLHPTIIKAWLNFVHRLTAISIDQVQAKIYHNDLTNYTAHPQIKNLVHIFLAERDYAQTWDDELKTFIGSTDPVTIANANVQSAIYSAESYRVYNRYLSNMTVGNYTLDAPIYARPFERADIDQWVKLSQQYPGILPIQTTANSTNHYSLSHPYTTANSTPPNIAGKFEFTHNFRGSNTKPGDLDLTYHSNTQDFMLALPLVGLAILMLAYLARKMHNTLYSFNRHRSANHSHTKSDERELIQQGSNSLNLSA